MNGLTVDNRMIRTLEAEVQTLRRSRKRMYTEEYLKSLSIPKCWTWIRTWKSWSRRSLQATRHFRSSFSARGRKAPQPTEARKNDIQAIASV